MNTIRVALAVIFVFLLAGVSQAQTSEIAGTVVDAAGKPIAGAEVAAANLKFPERVNKGTSDKKGNYLVVGLVYATTAQDWSISIKADGYVPVSVKTVARNSQNSLYLSDEVKLSAAKAATTIRVSGLSHVRMEFKMRSADAATEVSPDPSIPSTGAGAGGVPAVGEESFAQAVEKVRAGDSEGSVELFKKAIEERPDDWERRDVFAKVLLQLDRQGEATIQANKAVQMAPDKAAPLITLTDIYLARGLADKAAESIAKAQLIEPGNTKAQERAAAIAASTGKLDEAIAMTQRMVAAKPNNTELLVSLAALYNRNKQPKKAEEILNKVVELDPENAHRTFYNLGVVIENRDDVTETDHRKSIEAFRKAIDLKSDYGIAHRDLGFALLRVGDLPGARKELQKYADLEPRAKDAADIKATIKSLDTGK